MPVTSTRRSWLWFRRAIWAAALFITATVAASLTWNLINEREETLRMALAVAQGAHRRDIDYRRWNAAHGGVYVPVTDDLPPNEYLANAPNRDLVTTSGMKLTLVNPAYMTRQAHEMGTLGDGILGHITSLNPIRPSNAPDAWEIKALESFEHGATEAHGVEEINGEPYMRFMKPMSTEESCMTCHASQGYKVGDVRGGIGVSVPMKPWFAWERSHIAPLIVGHAALWLIGMGGLGLVSRSLRKRIREREEAVAALHGSEARLRYVVENMPIIMGAFGEGGTIVSWNREAERVTGYSRDEIVGTPDAMNMLHPNAAYLAEMMREWEQRGNDYRGWEWETTCKDGSTRTIAWSSVSERMPIPGWTAWGIGVDVTEQKHTEEMLRRRVAFDALVTRIATDFINSPTDAIDTGINRALAAIGEFSDTDRSYVFLLSDDVERMSNTHEWCREGITPYIDDLQELQVDSFGWVRDNVVRDGKVTYLPRVSDLPAWASDERAEFERQGIQSMIMVPMRSGDRTIGFVGFDSVCQEKNWSDEDITLLRIVAGVFTNTLQRKRSEEARRGHVKLLESLDRIDRTIRGATDLDRMLEATLDTLLDIFKADRAWLLYPCDPDAPSWHVPMERTRPEYPGAYELNCDHRQDETSRAIMLAALASDEPSVQMRSSEFPGGPEWINQYSIQSQISIPVYPKTGKAWVLGMHQCSHERVWTTSDRHHFKEIARRITDGLSSLLFLRDLQQSEGELRQHREHLEELVEQRSRELAESREKLEQAERLASIGTLAAGLAHEINNPVGGILLAAENACEARLRPNPDSVVSSCLDDIITNAQRCGDIIRSVLRFARHERSEKAPCDLNNIIRRSLQHTEDYANEHGASVTLTLEADLLPIQANALEIEQVFANLIRNAAEASTDRIDIRIRTESGEGVIRASVSDTGRGIPQERLKRLFDPFFTTRLEKGGTGLGLSIVHGIIEEHGAAIDVRSEIGKGTTFTIEFPSSCLPSEGVDDDKTADRR